MSTRTKIVITVLLAILCSWLFGCGGEHLVPLPRPSLPHGEVDAAYLESLYEVYNVGYFDSKLPKVVVIDMLEANPDFMASTMKNADGTFVIKFNPHFVVAVRTAELTMQHEMCHVKTWDMDTTDFGGKTVIVDHGRHWRTCMLELDAQGANRQVLIDNYFEAVR